MNEPELLKFFELLSEAFDVAALNKRAVFLLKLGSLVIVLLQ
jgi:hypothetical protein